MLNSATPDFNLPSSSPVGLLPEKPACYGVIMGMSTVLLEGVSRRWVRSGTFTRCQCLNGTYKMMRVRRKIVFHPSSIHPSGNRKEGRKEETHSRDVFPHFLRASVGCAGGAPAKAKAPCVTNGREGRGEEEACRHDGSRRAYIVMDKVVMT